MGDDLIKQMEEFECDWRGGYGARLMKAARDRIRELESRLATAEADALERAAELCDASEARIMKKLRKLEKPNADLAGAAAVGGADAADRLAYRIRALKPKGQE